jgi:hypothetical protein
MIIESPRVARPSTSDTPEVMLQGLKTALYTADANWLGTLIRSWPEPCPPQDDDDIIWNFARNFMTWRDGIVQQAERGRKETVGRLLYLFSTLNIQTRVRRLSGASNEHHHFSGTAAPGLANRVTGGMEIARVGSAVF